MISWLIDLPGLEGGRGRYKYIPLLKYPLWLKRVDTSCGEAILDI